MLKYSWKDACNTIKMHYEWRKLKMIKYNYYKNAPLYTNDENDYKYVTIKVQNTYFNVRITYG